MLSKDDKNFLIENFVTRGEFRERLDVLQETYEQTEKKIDTVLNKLDGFVGKIADLEQENKMGSITLQRHEVNINELAKAIKTRISR